MRRWTILACGFAFAASACCPCDSDTSTKLFGDAAPDDSQVEFGSMEPSGPPPDLWASEPPSWGQLLPYSHQASLMLEAATPHKRGSIKHGLVLCDVYITSDERYDTFADPDPAATLTLGERAPLYARGGEERLGMVFAVPGVTVEEGERWKLLVVDRDITSSDLVGESAATYKGSSPLNMRHENFRAACHVFPREEVEPYAVEALKQADRSLSSPELKQAPKLGLKELGYPRPAFDLSELGIGNAAALLTWADPRVQERIKRLEEQQERWKERADAAIQAELKQSEPGGWRALPGWEGLKARVTQVRFRPGEGYRLTLELKNAGKKNVALKLGQFIGSEGFAQLLFKGGRSAEVKPDVEQGEDGVTLNLAPGEQEEVVYAESAPQDGPQPKLLGVQFGKNEQAIILRAPRKTP